MSTAQFAHTGFAAYNCDRIGDLIANKMTNSNNNLHFLSRGMVNWDERGLEFSFEIPHFLQKNRVLQNDL